MSKVLLYAAGPILALCFFCGAATSQEYVQVNLVANTSGVAPVTDANLLNAWGLARSSSSPWWVADANAGVSTLYNGVGAKQALTVTIPAAISGQTGSPSGVIVNGSTTNFLLAANTPARFIFATLDGTIVGWSSTTNAVAMVKMTDGSSYTGLTTSTIQGKSYLYAANFNKGRVDVFDTTFKRVDIDARADDDASWDMDHGWGRGEAEGFVDHRLPDDYVPFNVQTIGDNIVVTYALHQEGNRFETDGPGLGYVDIFTSSGQLVQRLEHGNWLNAPWGVALAPLDFGLYSHDLLIGQFAGGGTTESSGYVAAYDMATGRYEGLLEDTTGKPLAVNGIWAISPGNESSGNLDPAGAPSAELYFTAGPNRGAGGLFGYLKAATTDLIQGNDQ